MKSRHHFLLEVDPLRDGVVQLSLWQIDEHSCDLGSFLITNKFFNVLVDRVANEVLLLIFLRGFKLLRNEQLLDLIEVSV